MTSDGIHDCTRSNSPKALKLLVFTDTTPEQVNGVARCLDDMVASAPQNRVSVSIRSAIDYPGFQLPWYPAIRIAFPTTGEAIRAIRDVDPDAVHLMTEGPVGRAGKRACLKLGIQFTTSYHTRFPEYLERLWIPKSVTYASLRKFHAAAKKTFVSSTVLGNELLNKGFRSNLVVWPKGVDTSFFYPRTGVRSRETNRVRVLLYVGRVSGEKNIEEFLRVRIPHTRKVVVGDGPDLLKLYHRYPDVIFRGVLRGENLAQAYSAADVLVFPSKTDTFGSVMLEAMACGTPVAAHPVTGPLVAIGSSGAGALCSDLGVAIERALSVNRAEPVKRAAQFSRDDSFRTFFSSLAWKR